MAAFARNDGNSVRSHTIACLACRHQAGVGYEGLTPAEAEFMHRFKVGHDFVTAGAWVGGRNAIQPLLFTLYSGLALKCRVESDGESKPAGIILPGSFVGLESVTGNARVKVKALTDITICRFDPDRWRDLFASPAVAERLCRLETIARAEAEDRLLAAGRSATSNVCHFLLHLYDGLRRRKLVRDESFGLPVSLSLAAELLGLTPVHLRRILRRLAEDRVVRIVDHRVHVEDEDRLRALAGTGCTTALPPLI